MNIHATPSMDAHLRPRRRRVFLLAFRVAVRDLAIDWRNVLCVILGFSAVLTPIMVLFSLKFGIMDTLRRDMLDDPKTLEIVLRGNHQLDLEWFQEISKNPGVKFVVPKTRSIAATINLQNLGGTRVGRAELAELIPTGPGDPLLAKMPGLSELDLVVLSAALAADLGVVAGDAVTGFVTRTADGRRERADIELQVAGVLGASSYGRPAVFTPLGLLSAVEDYRDGFAVDRLGWPGKAREAPRTTYASARLYAKDLLSVPALASHLEDVEGIPVASRASDVAGLLGLDRSLTLGFWIIAGMAGGGFFFSLAAALWSNVERKRTALGTLMLIGFSKISLMAIPTIQSIVLGILGVVISMSGYLLAALFIEHLFGTVVGIPGADICQLLPSHIAAMAMMVFVFCVTAAMWATSRIFDVGVANSLRER